MTRTSVVLALSLLLPPAAVLAHGGEDHGEKKPTVSVGEKAPSAGGAGDLFEVLVKYKPTPAGEATELKVFVADVKTNEPISGAEVELTFTGKGELRATPTSTDSPGIYLASVTFPADGELDAVVSVSRGEEADLITLGTVRAGVPPEAVAPHEHPGSGWWMTLAGVGVALVVGITFVLLRTRRRPREVPYA
ncbi:MAG: hypothetical protein ACOZIN_09065 [Myxococcota bacterium]